MLIVGAMVAGWVSRAGGNGAGASGVVGGGGWQTAACLVAIAAAAFTVSMSFIACYRNAVAELGNRPGARIRFMCTGILAAGLSAGFLGTFSEPAVPLVICGVGSGLVMFAFSAFSGSGLGFRIDDGAAAGAVHPTV